MINHLSETKFSILRRLQMISKSFDAPFMEWFTYASGLDNFDLTGSCARSSLLLLCVPKTKIALDLACIVEIVHQASLIADDCVDRSLERRGRQVFWKKYGIGSATIAPHYFLNEAFGLLDRLNLDTETNKSLTRKLRMTIAEMASAEAGVISEPITDMQSYEIYVSGKTSALYGFVGACICALTDNQTDLENMFRDIGFLRQLADDIQEYNYQNLENYETARDWKNDALKSVCFLFDKATTHGEVVGRIENLKHNIIRQIPLLDVDGEHLNAISQIINELSNFELQMKNVS